MTSLVAQRVKHPPAMQKTWVQSLGREDPLETEMVTHSSILAWRIPWTEEPGGLQSMGLQRVRHHWVTNTHTEGWSKIRTEESFRFQWPRGHLLPSRHRKDPDYRKLRSNACWDKHSSLKHLKCFKTFHLKTNKQKYPCLWRQEKG